MHPPQCSVLSRSEMQLSEKLLPQNYCYVVFSHASLCRRCVVFLCDLDFFEKTVEFILLVLLVLLLQHNAVFLSTHGN